MATPPTIKPSGIRHSEQNIQNWSFDDDFGVLMAEVVTYNPISGNLERETKIQGNPSFALTYTSGDLTQIDMTIGTVTYRKTLTYTSGDLTAISVWSVV